MAWTQLWGQLNLVSISEQTQQLCIPQTYQAAWYPSIVSVTSNFDNNLPAHTARHMLMYMQRCQKVLGSCLINNFLPDTNNLDYLFNNQNVNSPKQQSRN